MENELKLYKDAYFLKSFYCMGRSYSVCLGCEYCRAKGKEQSNGFWAPPSYLNPLFKDIPVSVNIFHGDPMLYWKDTFRCLDALEESGHRGPVVIVTKGSLLNFPLHFKQMKESSLRIHFGLSYFGNEKYDKFGTAKYLENNLKLARQFKDELGWTYNIEYRPLINGINDDPHTMDVCFRLAKEYKASIAYSGLQVERELADHIKENNLPFKPYDGFDFGMKKNISDEVERRMREFSGQYDIPIFKKTSCAITYEQNRDRDYNAHYYRPNEVGCYSCPNSPKCFSFKDFNAERVNDEFIKCLPFDLKLVHKEHHSCRLHRDGLCRFPSPDCLDINGWLLQTDRKLTTSDVRLIKWLTGFTVDAEFTELPYIQEDWLK